MERLVAAAERALPPEAWRLTLLVNAIEITSAVAVAAVALWHDWRAHQARALAKRKLPTRYPLDPFWGSYAELAPNAAFNLCVSIPLGFLVCMPLWAATHAPSLSAWWARAGWATPAVVIAAFLAHDLLFYTVHRWMHTRSGWWLHRQHHIGAQSAVGATYGLPLEMFLLNVVHTLPYAAIGLPPQLFAGYALIFGLANTAGHSGWAGGGKGAHTHNAHHVWPFVNFGNLEVADKAFGTWWEPGMPPPKARRGPGLSMLD